MKTKVTIDNQNTTPTQFWNDLPIEIKLNISKFLTNREITLFSRVNHSEYDLNRRIFICSNVKHNHNQIIKNADLTRVIAQLLKVKPEDIKKSELFETTIMHFIRELDPLQVPFLTLNTDITNHANYSLSNERIGFRYKLLTKEQVIKMAIILEQFFPGIKSKLSQDKESDPYWISFDKNIFLQQVLPCVFNVNRIPIKQTEFEQPQIRDWAPKKFFFIMRKDHAPLTDADKELILKNQPSRF